MLDILSIGTATADIFIKTPFLGRIKRGSKTDINDPYVTVGGGAYNSAYTFAKQGFAAGLVACIGNDIFGNLIQTSVSKTKLKTFFLKSARIQTGVSFILLDASGERTIFVHRGCSGAFSETYLKKNVPRSKWAYINPGAMPLPLLSWLVGMLYARGTHVAINPSLDMLKHGFTKIRPILNKSRVVILNREEAAVLTKTPYKKKDMIFRKLDADVLGIAIMTDGAKETYVSDGATIIGTRAVPVKRVIDMTGAGDAFGSGFISALIEKGEVCEKGACNAGILSYALKKGALNAASVIQHIGATEGIVKT